MRDPNRINEFCNEFAQLWHKVPDWRFAQLMMNIVLAYQHKYSNAPFYVEDEEYMKFMKNYLKEILKVA